MKKNKLYYYIQLVGILVLALTFANLGKADQKANNDEVGFSAIILSYESISDKTPPSKSTSPKIFAQHIEELKAQGFTFWRLSDVMRGIQKRAKLPPKLVAVTFDHGFKSVLQNAFPILEKNKIPFTVFVSRDYVEYDNPLYLNMSDLKKLGASNLMELGNNSLGFGSLARKKAAESNEDWQKRIINSISENAKWLQDNFKATRLFAYPKGEVHSDLEKIAKKMRFYAFTKTPGAASLYSPLVKVPRFDMTGSKNLAGFKNKVLSVPFPIKKMNYVNDAILSENSRPMLELDLYLGEYRIDRLRCFDDRGYKIPASYEYIKLKPKENSLYRIKMRPTQELKGSSAMYTCVMPHNSKNNWFWFSKKFF